MTTTPAPRIAYRPANAALMVDVSEKTIRRMIAAGKLATVPNMGTMVLIPHAELVRVFGTTSATLRAVAS